MEGDDVGLVTLWLAWRKRIDPSIPLDRGISETFSGILKAAVEISMAAIEKELREAGVRGPNDLDVAVRTHLGLHAEVKRRRESKETAR
jgi:hypothetical protein